MLSLLRDYTSGQKENDWFLLYLTVQNPPEYKKEISPVFFFPLLNLIQA